MAQESFNYDHLFSRNLLEVGSLLFKYYQGEITEEEKTILDNWRNASPENEALFTSLTQDEQLQAKLNQWHEIEGTREAARKRVMDMLFPGALVTPLRRTGY